MRDMLATDLSEAVAIEQKVQPSPWARLSFEESLAKEYCCRVVCQNNDDQTVVAYHVVCLVSDELHILNLVVAKEFQGQGIAHILMHDIVDIANSSTQTKKLFLEVRSGNEVAQNLYKQWQFEQIALRKKYYRGAPGQEREDALVLVKMLN